MKPFTTNPKHLRRALIELGSRATRNDLHLELAVCHGRCLACAARSSGRPVPIAMPNGLARTLIAGVTESMRLPRSWIEEELAEYLVQLAASGKLVQEGRDTALQFSINETARVLARKLLVLELIDPKRDSDDADALHLLRGMREVTEAQVEAIFSRYCPDSELGPVARELIARETTSGRLRA